MFSVKEERDFLSFISNNGRRCLAVIEAYIDESGTHRGSPLLSVACYFAPHSRWGAFQRSWRPILKEKRIPCFHAKKREHDKARPDLAKIIHECKLNGVFVTVNREIYNSYASDHMKSFLGDPYATCVINCVIRVCRVTKEKYYGESVIFIIEMGQPKTEHLESKIKSMKNEPLYPDCAPISGILLAKKEEFIPLQTADFLSHVVSKGEVDWVNELCKKGLIYHSRITQKELEKSSFGIENMYRRIKWNRNNLTKR